jgi:hypothetical protein
MTPRRTRSTDEMRSVMRPRRIVIIATLTGAIVVLGSSRWGLSAQDEKSRPALAARLPVASAAKPGIEEALTRRFSFPFADETTLESAAKFLQKELGAAVVLDLAALKRQGITADAHVKLDLKDVRLKTGLKLLLDQAGLTYKVVAEDNLLVLTDERGADDPTSRIFAELRELHRDMHDLRDALDDLARQFGPVDEGGPAIRKPTIIEDMPAEKDKGKGDEPVGRSRPGL